MADNTELRQLLLELDARMYVVELLFARLSAQLVKDHFPSDPLGKLKEIQEDWDNQAARYAFPKLDPAQSDLMSATVQDAFRRFFRLQEILLEPPART